MLNCVQKQASFSASTLVVCSVRELGVLGILGHVVLSSLVTSPLMTLYTLEIMKTPTSLSFQAWKLHPVKWGMSETLMEVDLLLEDIVGWLISKKKRTWVCQQTGIIEHATKVVHSAYCT